MECTPGTDYSLYDAVMELGTGHLAEYHQAMVSGDKAQATEEISLAIAEFSRAYEIRPHDRPLVNLANAHWRRYEINSDIYRSDMDLAISKQRQGIALQAKGSVVSMNNLGNMLRRRFEAYSHVDSQVDLDDAIDAFRQAMPLDYESPSVSIDAARSCGELLAKYRSAAVALDVFGYAMDLIPRLASTGRRLLRRFDFLPKARESVEAAVATAIDAGRLDLALEWFDRGRCVIWFQIMQTRLSLDDLRSVDPKLADDVASTQQQASTTQAHLEAIKGQPITTPGRHELYEAAAALSTKLNVLIQRVRGLDGFQEFMQYKNIDELRRASKSSPVVVLSVYSEHCDALIIPRGNNDIVHVPLPQFSYQAAIGMAKRFHDVLLGARVLTRGVSDPNVSIDPTRSLQLELTKLWRCVVGPILDSLGYTNADSRSASHAPRVVWCPSGPLCFLPLHAAGVYLDSTKSVGSLNRAIDLVVSSYTPSLSSLLGSLEKPIAPGRTLKRILAVSQSDPPGWPRIPLTYNEVFTIRDLVGVEKLQWLDDKAATVEAVLGMLKAEECSCVHLACHGVQDSVDPLQSGFVLHDGKMTLREIMGLDISRKELAILSACETATGDNTSPEEALHLAAGMLMAGYANVVGTMWSIQDEDAPVVVRELYAHLIDSGGNSQVAEGSVARALHDAVRALREKVGERNFVRWMPFIHYGL